MCTVSSCNSYFKLNSAKEMIEQCIEHSHERIDKAILNRRLVSNNLKRKADDDISVHPSKLLSDFLKMQDVLILTIKDTTRIKMILGTARRSAFSSLPKSTIKSHDTLDNLQIISNTNENMLMFNDTNSHIVLFSTQTNLMTLTKHEFIFVDGTFYSCPKFFAQVYGIHVFQNNIYKYSISHIPYIFH